jgi:hypothetical protein
VNVLTVAEPREYLEELVRERQEDYASLSRLIGRNPSYIQQFIKRGSPKRLDEKDRKTLARYFGVPEVLLGGQDDDRPSELRKIPRLSVQASAGPGRWRTGKSRPMRCASAIACCATSPAVMPADCRW